MKRRKPAKRKVTKRIRTEAAQARGAIRRAIDKVLSYCERIYAWLTRHLGRLGKYAAAVADSLVLGFGLYRLYQILPNNLLAYINR